jgi:hypothetical protein
MDTPAAAVTAKSTFLALNREAYYLALLGFSQRQETIQNAFCQIVHSWQPVLNNKKWGGLKWLLLLILCLWPGLAESTLIDFTESTDLDHTSIDFSSPADFHIDMEGVNQ